MAAATSKKSTMRRFVLERGEDVSGTSGTGVVMEGVEYSDGTVGIHWISQLSANSVYANMKVCLALHGHDGKSKIVWLDE